MTTADAICRAIRSRHLLSFTYKGDERTVAPYILGLDAKGVPTLSGVQFAGGSGTGFRSYVVDEISALAVTEHRFFRNHPDYNPRDRLFARILCQVA
ncbi:WYL domain-containing protein [Mesorhizobium sp. SP-1A]|uniref:WYL domain-containing protein n=1 Tax=Mesorhizobium sp. SP-1A TaxID=3077840 RepID=UPI0028F6EB6F|nr:WYL domain-containing protein [Mesorhizobium sp. SP-1A]